MEINENICQPGSAIQSFIAGDFDDLDYVLFVFDYMNNMKSIGNKNIDLLTIVNKIVYAGYPYNYTAIII